MISEPAPAKINLFLRVIGRRDDGYHLLESLVAFADFGDGLTVRPAETLGLRIAGDFASPLAESASDNLVIRAARRLAESAGIGAGAEITLQKNLPVAAGLGGGSADAAAALRALNRLWDVGLTEEALAGLALTLGADTPVCLAGAPAMMRGIGEHLTPAPIPPGLGVVLANPLQPLATAAVFADFHAHERFAEAAGGFDWTAPHGRDEWLSELRRVGNGLAPSARRLLPITGEVIAALAGLDGCLLARMSGSGASCFGLFESREATARQAAMLAEARPGWWIAAGALPQ